MSAFLLTPRPCDSSILCRSFYIGLDPVYLDPPLPRLVDVRTHDPAPARQMDWLNWLDWLDWLDWLELLNLLGWLGWLDWLDLHFIVLSDSLL